MKNYLKVALVYDRVNTRFGGAEHVLTQLLKAFPQAPLFTPISTRQADWVDHQRVQATFLNRIPVANQHHEWLTLLMPWAVESLDLSTFDVIISVSSAEAKGILTLPHQLHICYLLSPPRYLYRFSDSYRGSYGWVNWPGVRQIMQLARRYMLWWDQAAIWRPDVLVPISRRVGRQIEEGYGRSPHPVIYPPFVPRQDHLPKLETKKIRHQYLLSISRLTWYKRVDLSIQACLAENWPLVVVGEGREAKSLHQQAGNKLRILSPQDDLLGAVQACIRDKAILFTGALSDTQVGMLIAQAKAVLAPGVDDFGLTPLDALHHQTIPIVARSSGVSELLEHFQTAIILPEASVTAVRQAIHQLASFTLNQTARQQILNKTNSQSYIQSMTTLLYDEWQKKESICPTTTTTP